MLPPAPAATKAFKSPNACNLCHPDKSPEWADEWVKKWRPRDFQASIISRAILVDAARKRDWSKLPEMLDYVTGKNRERDLRCIAYPSCPVLRRPAGGAGAAQGHQRPFTARACRGR